MGPLGNPRPSPGRALALGWLIALALALVAPFAARAATPEASGYWWKLQTGSGPRLGPPANVPPGGLWVASDVSGQQAVSAIRYRAAAQEVIQAVVLTVAETQGEPVILACPATGSWSSTQAGVWREAPKYDCGVAAVTGEPSTDLQTWRFDVAAIARTGDLNVVILSPSDNRTVFSVSFQPPGADTIITARSSPSPTPTQTGSTGPTPSSRPTVSPRASVLADKTAGDIGTPPPPSEPPAPVPTPEPEPEETAAALAAPAPLEPFDDGPRSRSWLWSFAAIPVIGLIMWMIRVGRYPIAPPPPPGPGAPATP